MLKTVTTPSGAVYTYSYGDNGRITETVNARNVTAVRNRYDSLFRVTHQEFPDGGTMDFEYDDKNSRVTLTERNGSRITYVKVNCKRIFYCDRKLKYGSSVSEVKDVERSGKKIDVILENEMRLTIYDIEEEGRKIT